MDHSVHEPDFPAAAKKKKPFPVKWIALGAAVCILAVAVVCLFAGREPRVRNAREAAALLADRAEEMGYENALSELTELHTNTVSGDSYYRLQQNYRGIPVYGRTVVYAADEQGRQLSVTQNLQDIPEELDLTPTVTLEQAQQSVLAYLTENQPEGNWSECPEFVLDPEDLCIYDLDGKACLAYETCTGTLCLLIDAHTGQVLNAYTTVRSATATFGFSSDTLEVPQLPGGQYVLKDEANGIYVYSAEGNTYFDRSSGKMNFGVLKLVQSNNLQFGENVPAANRDDNMDSASVERAKESLDCVRDIHEYYTNLMNAIPTEKLVLICDDKLGIENGNNAGGWYPPVKYVLGSAPFDSNDPEEPVGSIILGTVYSADPYQYADIIAHEYTHFVTGKYVDWTHSSKENEALNEAFSDIFGELIQAKIDGTAPDWEIGNRPIYNPNDRKYPDALDEKIWIPTDSGWGIVVLNKQGDVILSDIAHGYSTIISHTAYHMWEGLPGVKHSSMSSDELAELWYRTMLMLPSDADFSDCRAVVTLAAQAMGLSDAQLQCIEQAFDDAGIPDQAEEDGYTFLAGLNCRLEVYGQDLEPFYNYSITVEEQCNALEQRFGDPVYFTSEIEKDEVCMLSLEKGLYQITLTNLADTAQTITFSVQVQKGEADTLPIYTNFVFPNSEEPLPLPELPGEEPTEPAQTEPEDTEVNTSGDVPYRIVRWDRSYTTEDGTSGMVYYFDYVVLESDSDACRKINEVLYADAEEFMSRHTIGSVITAGGSVPIIGTYSAESHVIYNKNNLLCIKVSTLDAMGGNTDHVDSYSMFFSLNTGETATLCDLTGMDEETLLPELRRIAWEGLQRTCGSMLLDSAESTVSNMTLEEFDYYVVDEQIWLHFEKYSVAPGVCGAQNVPTGLYIGGGNASGEQSADGKAELGSEGPVDYTEAKLDCWDRKLNEMNHENAMVDCEYLILSGGGAAERINADLYRIAEAFVTTYTREEIEEFHYAFDMPYHFTHHGSFEVTHNGDGIFSVILAYHGFWGEDSICDAGKCGYVYSLATGEQLTLMQLTGLTEGELLQLLKDGALDYLQNYRQKTPNLMPTDETLALLDNLSVADFGVYVSEDGQIWVTLNYIHFRQADPPRGYWQTISFPLDLYI